MPTQYAEIFGALGAPFGNDEVKVRTQAGRPLKYITARTVMNRLDDVVGPENWWTDWKPGQNSVICYLSVRLPDEIGTVVTKSDAGGYAGMADQGDDDKSGFSDGLKRAAVLFGIGRELYGDGVAGFVPARAPGSGPDRQPPERERGHDAPRESYPAPGNREPARDAGNGNGNRGGNGHNQGPPRSGKALFAWTKEMEEKHEVGLLKYINQWSKLQDWPGRMVDWDAEQVALAYAEASRKLATVGGDRGEAHEEALQN